MHAGRPWGGPAAWPRARARRRPRLFACRPTRGRPTSSLLPGCRAGGHGGKGGGQLGAQRRGRWLCTPSAGEAPSTPWAALRARGRWVAQRCSRNGSPGHRCPRCGVTHRRRQATPAGSSPLRCCTAGGSSGARRHSGAQAVGSRTLQGRSRTASSPPHTPSTRTQLRLQLPSRARRGIALGRRTLS